MALTAQQTEKVKFSGETGREDFGNFQVPQHGAFLEKKGFKECLIPLKEKNKLMPATLLFALTL